MIDVGQHGREVGVYAVDHTGERFGLALTAGSWTPSVGFSPRTRFGGVVSKFGGDVSSIQNGALLSGFDPERARRLRVLTRGGLVRWGGRDSAVICHEPGALFDAHVLEDGSTELMIVGGSNCVPGGCLGFVVLSTDLDGGFSCPLEAECDDVCRSGDGFGRLHPKARIGSFVSSRSRSGGQSFGFAEWDRQGKFVRAARVTETTRRFLGRFWPTLERLPTRIQMEVDGGGPTEFSSSQVNPEAHLSFLVWEEDGGTRTEEAPFAGLIRVVDSLTELPTGVAVSGRRVIERGASAKDLFGAYLVDASGTRVLGRFQTSDGFPLAPNVFVESQYFKIAPFLQEGDDAEPRNYSGVLITPVEFIPVD